MRGAIYVLILQFCVFFLFVSVYKINSRKLRNNALTFNFNIFSGEKVILVGEFGRSKFKILRSFKKHQEKQTNNSEKMEIFTQNRKVKLNLYEH